ncbi:hypothetical protein J3458_009296 [Metarhizium acridum]|uniref:uncharacterized protein n=1 Tax=Metarhizium acridum TaxID=92637 RepID=UPI001C6C5DB7|nr:hypothetical protein J3458_009296 [Metarhizium acridum]
MWWAEQPEQGSLRAIIQAHNREGILVRGIAWTGIHLQILDVRFLQGEEKLGQARSICQIPRGDTVVAYLRSCIPSVQKTGIQELLELLDFHDIGQKLLDLDFDGRAVDAIHTDGVFKNDTGSSCIAYLNFDTVSLQRKLYI